MPQSLSRLHVHLVFSTKQRVPLIRPEIREPLHRYMAVVMQNKKSPALIINSVEDHVHLLFDLARTESMSAVVEEVKTSSSKWIKTQGPEYRSFGWQTGYGAFAVSALEVPHVTRYIATQEEHHRKMSFQEEYLEFLKQHGIPFDERYLWD